MVRTLPDVHVRDLAYGEASLPQALDPTRVELAIDEARVEPLALHLDDQRHVDSPEVDPTDPP